MSAPSCTTQASFHFVSFFQHLDTVSRQIFGDIQDTQFSGSKIEVHVLFQNAFPSGIGNRRIRFGYNLWFASHPSLRSQNIFFLLICLEKVNLLQSIFFDC